MQVIHIHGPNFTRLVSFLSTKFFAALKSHFNLTPTALKRIPPPGFLVRPPAPNLTGTPVEISPIFPGFPRIPAELQTLQLLRDPWVHTGPFRPVQVGLRVGLFSRLSD